MKNSFFLLFYLTILFGCSSDNNSVETRTPVLPTADFSASETNIEEGSTVSFSDGSQHADTYTWTFEGGNPVVSSSKDQDVVYDSAGTYTVTLKVTNSDGEDTETKTDYITVSDPAEKPETDFTASETTITSGNDIMFTDTSANDPTSWSWEFEGGIPATSTEQNPVVRYTNSGTYEVKLTATNSGGSVEEIKAGYITVNQQTASYTVTFQGNWTAANHPTDFPTGADHFSDLIGMVHKEGATIFEEGELATSGIKDMAEMGNNGDLQDEIDALVNSGVALNRVNGGGLSGGTEMVSVTIDVTEEFSMVTLVSMIAPSPDWFVAAEDVDLFENGEFLDNLTFNGISYDSGTDSGSSFNSGDDVTNPAENIILITDVPLGNGTTVDPPVAIFTFVKN